jgi:hypothetical protein
MSNYAFSYSLGESEKIVVLTGYWWCCQSRGSGRGDFVFRSSAIRLWLNPIIEKWLLNWLDNAQAFLM